MEIKVTVEVNGVAYQAIEFDDAKHASTVMVDFFEDLYKVQQEEALNMIGTYRDRLTKLQAVTGHLFVALDSLVKVIRIDNLMPESVSYMKQAVKALEAYRQHAIEKGE